MRPHPKILFPIYSLAVSGQVSRVVTSESKLKKKNFSWKE